jgi:hypothetical protein
MPASPQPLPDHLAEPRLHHDRGAVASLSQYLYWTTGRVRICTRLLAVCTRLLAVSAFVIDYYLNDERGAVASRTPAVLR